MKFIMEFPRGHTCRVKTTGRWERSGDRVGGARVWLFG